MEIKESKETITARLKSKLAGHVKDAFMHTMCQAPIMPTEAAFEEIATYLLNSGAVDDAFQSPYIVLRSAVNKALAVKDSMGKEFITVRGDRYDDLPLAEVRDFLVAGTKDADHYLL